MPEATVTMGDVDYGMTAAVRQHQLQMDEPEDKGGKDTGPTPTEMICAAFGGCTTATLKMYLNRKEWEVQSIKVHVAREIDEAKNSTFNRTITIESDLDDKQLDRLLKIANACPVHKILENNNVIKTKIK